MYHTMYMYQNVTNILLVFLCLTATALSQLELEETCDFADKIQPLDVPGLLGNWSEVKRVKNSIEVGQCSYWNIDIGEGITSLQADIDTRGVYQRELVFRNGTIGVNLATGVLRFSYSDGVSIDYVVQKTDYINYAVLYGCNNNNNKRSVYGHLLTRPTGDSTVAITEFNSVLEANADLKVATWEDISHSDEACDTVVDLFNSL